MLRVIREAVFLTASILCVLGAFATMFSQMFGLDLFRFFIIALIISIIPGSLFLVKQSAGE